MNTLEKNTIIIGEGRVYILRRVRRRVASKFAIRVGREGWTASASERRLASHLLRRQSMTLPSTVEEQRLPFTHTHTTYTQTHTLATIKASATPACPEKLPESARLHTSSGIVCFRGSDGAKAGRRRMLATPGRTKERLGTDALLKNGSAPWKICCDMDGQSVSRCVFAKTYYY